MYRRRAVTVDAMQFTIAATITLSDGRQVDVPEGDYGIRNPDGTWAGVAAKDYFERDYEEIVDEPEEEKPVARRSRKPKDEPEPLFAFKADDARA